MVNETTIVNDYFKLRAKSTNFAPLIAVPTWSQIQSYESEIRSFHPFGANAAELEA
jgi:hypothetical protein